MMYIVLIILALLNMASGIIHSYKSNLMEESVRSYCESHHDKVSDSKACFKEIMEYRRP